MAGLRTPFKVIAHALRDWWDDWFNQIAASVILLLCWFSIVLGPPATFGLNYIANQLAHGSSEGVRGMLEGGRRYFFKSWLWALVFVAVLIILGVNFLFYGQIAATWGSMLQGLFLGLSVVWMIVQFYALPYLLEQEQQQIRLALRNGLLTMLAAPGYTTVVVGVSVLLAVISVLFVFPLLVGVPGLIAILANRAVLERMETFGVRAQDADGQGDRDDGSFSGG